MKIPSVIAAAMLAALPWSVVQADRPNIQPGEWEYENVTTFEGEMDIPEQRDTTRECVTEEDIEEGLVTPDDSDMGDCEIVDQKISSSSMTYDMACTDPQGGEMTMSAEMQFMGDRATGSIRGEMESPMGRITVHSSMEGRRIGDC